MSEKEFKAKFTADNSDLNRKINETESRSQKFASKMEGFAKVIASAWVFQKVLQGLGAIIKSTSQFETALARLSSITGAIGDDLKFYGQASKDIARTSLMSASEVVEAFTLMGSARPELLKNKEALAAVTKEAIVLSEASGLDLTTATEALAKAMNQFNVPATEAVRVINVLAAGSKEGAMEVPGLADAIRNMGTAAAMANISLESSVAMIETLADKGFEGAKAGIMLRNVILKLQSGAEEFNPAVIGMTKALDNLGTANLSAAQLTEMFGLENQQAAAVLIQNRTRFNDLTLAITDTNTAYDQQSTNLDTVANKWKIFTGVLKDATIQTDEFNEKAGKSIDKWTKLVEASKAEPAKKIKGWGKRGREFTEVDPEAEAADKVAEELKKKEQAQKDADEAARIAREEAAKAAELELKEKQRLIEEQRKHSLTIAGHREKIDELKASLESLNITEKQRAEEIQQQIKDIEELIDNVINYKTVVDSIPKAEISNLEFTVDPDTTGIQEYTGYIKQTSDALEAAKLSAASFGEQIMAAGIQGQGSMQAFGKTALMIAKKVIAAYVAEGVAAAVKSALIDVPFPFNIAAAGVAGGLAAAAINAAIPDFAAGGGVSGPTMALVGEAPGISRTNPEYIGTAKQLGQMGIGGGKRLEARVSRGDLLFILNEGEEYNTRNY